MIIKLTEKWRLELNYISSMIAKRKGRDTQASTAAHSCKNYQKGKTLTKSLLAILHLSELSTGK